MYSREVGSRTRTFGVSGKLWHGVLVMFDRETGSLWTQLDGRSIHGAERGQRLEHVPSVFTVWGMWREAHPDSLVLKKSPGEAAQKKSSYAAYFEDSGRLFQPRLGEGLGSELGPKEVVFGVRVNGETLAVAEHVLEERSVVNAHVATVPVALLRNFATGEVLAVTRLQGGREVELVPIEGAEPTERVQVPGGGIIEVKALSPLRVDRAYWYAWARTVARAGGASTVIVE